MPPAGQPVSALRDRAERHVFALLPDLPAIERRTLALLELGEADRATAAAEIGLDATAVRFAAKRARKALRRTRAPFAAGARCERAELLLSDRIDGPLERRDRKWLEIHLARCPRCTEHQTELEAARAELRATFAAEPPPQLPPAPEPPALPAARLRVVPPPAPEPPEPAPVVPDPEPEPVGGETRPTDGFVHPPAPPAPAAPVERRREVPPAVRKLALLLALLAALAAAGYGIAQLAGGDGDDRPTAPWNAPDAPEVHPAPLVDQ